MDETLGQLLVAEGFSTIDDIKDSSSEDLHKIEGIEEDTAKALIERAQELSNVGCPILCIDVAHGHHKLVKEAMRRLNNEVKGTFDLLVGNIATEEAARDLCEWGADG